MDALQITTDAIVVRRLGQVVERRRCVVRRDDDPPFEGNGIWNRSKRSEQRIRELPQTSRDLRRWEVLYFLLLNVPLRLVNVFTRAALAVYTHQEVRDRWRYTQFIFSTVHIRQRSTFKLRWWNSCFTHTRTCHAKVNWLFLSRMSERLLDKRECAEPKPIANGTNSNSTCSVPALFYIMKIKGLVLHICLGTELNRCRRWRRVN